MLSSSQPLREDWSAQNDEGIGGNLVLLTEPQLSLFQSMTMCTSDVKDADGVDWTETKETKQARRVIMGQAHALTLFSTAALR